MREQWSLSNNLGDDVISTFGHVPYVSRVIQNDRFSTSTFGYTHSHTFSHILTHYFFTFGCQTFFFHIWLLHILFSHLLHPHFFHNNCRWPASIAGEGAEFESYNDDWRRQRRQCGWASSAASILHFSSIDTFAFSLWTRCSREPRHERLFFHLFTLLHINQIVWEQAETHPMVPSFFFFDVTHHRPLNWTCIWAVRVTSNQRQNSHPAQNQDNSPTCPPPPI